MEDAHKHGVSQLMMVPCILVTFLLGPTGLLLYHVVRAVVGSKTKTR